MHTTRGTGLDPYVSNDTVSREAISWCYKLFLGREPASQQHAVSHLSRPSLDDLRAFFATHPVFQAYLATLAPRPAPVAAKEIGRLDYIIDKIRTAPIIEQPFRHIYIGNLFTDVDFGELIKLPEILVPPVDSDEALIAELQRRKFRAIPFPGTTTDLADYLAWHGDPSASKRWGSSGWLNEETCEGYGIVMRLQTVTPGTILAEANALFESDRFWTAAASRFGLHGTSFRREYGVQKYLDGYEISPHPDIRSKALTFMVNANPAADSENIFYHTHYLKFRPEYQSMIERWSTNLTTDRKWVPWNWCESHKIQTENNSMVMFSPGNDTLHAVKASYNHLQTQRTQFYGNLWYS